MASRRKPRDGRLITLTEAADMLGVHYSTIRRAIQRGDLRYVNTPGGFHRVFREDIERMAVPQLVEAGATVD